MAVSLISWMMIIVGLVCGFRVNFCMLGSVVFSDDAFHEMIWVLLLISWFILGSSRTDISGRGGGRMYYVIALKKISDSFNKLLD